MSIKLPNFSSFRSQWTNYRLRRRIRKVVAQRGIGRALDDLARLVSRSGSRPSDHTRYALALQETGRVDQAIEALKKATRLHPTSANVHRQLGLALLRVGRNLEARFAFIRAFLLGPNEPVLTTDLQGLHVALPLSLADSVRAFDFAEEPLLSGVASAIPHARLLRPAREAFRRQDWQAAALAYGRISTNYSRFANGHLQLGHALKELGRYDDAATSYWRALSALPRSPEILLQIGHLQKTRNSPDFLDAGLAAWRLQPGNVAVSSELSGQGFDYRDLMARASIAPEVEREAITPIATAGRPARLTLRPPEGLGLAERALWCDLTRAILTRG